MDALTALLAIAGVSVAFLVMVVLVLFVALWPIHRRPPPGPRVRPRQRR
jgi:hypothetical protein